MGQIENDDARGTNGISQHNGNRAVLVTGGTGGIGRHITAAFAAAGARVAISSRDGRAGEHGAEFGVELNLERPEGLSAAICRAIEGLEGLDTLVLNAVRWPEKTMNRFEDMDPDEWRAMLRANVEGSFAVIQAALPALRRSGRGRIVLISSGIAEEGHPVTPAYAAAKAALHGLGRALAWDTGSDGVLVNVVAVGFTRTEAGEERFPDGVFEKVGALIPQGRVSTGEDVARVVLWLGSDANTSVTGEVIREGTSAARTPLVALGD